MLLFYVLFVPIYFLLIKGILPSTGSDELDSIFYFFSLITISTLHKNIVRHSKKDWYDKRYFSLTLYSFVVLLVLCLLNSTFREVIIIFLIAAFYYPVVLLYLFLSYYLGYVFFYLLFSKKLSSTITKYGVAKKIVIYLGVIVGIILLHLSLCGLWFNFSP